MATQLGEAPAFEAITAVCVVEDRPPGLVVFQHLEDQLLALATDHEVVVIANGVPAEIAQELRGMTEQVGNVTVHFLAERVDRDTAVLVGIDRALGDWIVVMSPTMEEVAALPEIFAKAGPYEIIFAGARSQSEIPGPYRAVAAGYFKIYGLITGSYIDWPAPRIRVYSRAAARYLTTLLDGEFALRSLNLSGAFPGTRDVVGGLPSSDLLLPTAGKAVRKAFHGFLNANAVPLRAVIAVSSLSGVIAVVSSLYAVITYLTKENVTPGWTTLSLQISTMMLLFSLMFTLLAEYVLKTYRAMGPRRRLSVVREIRSPLRSKRARLNVVEADGSFRLGAPDREAQVRKIQ